MKKSRFSEEQIIGVFMEQQAGLPVAEVCRRRRWLRSGSEHSPIMPALRSRLQLERPSLTHGWAEHMPLRDMSLETIRLGRSVGSGEGSAVERCGKLDMCVSRER